MAKKSKKLLIRFEHPQLANASKTLLANIRFASVDNQIKTIVVTSSEQNAGKTIVSTNLANAIATAGKKVLIVEADMRRRTLGTLLDIHPPSGLYAALSGSVSLNEAILPTHIPNLYFLDAEPNIPSPADILSTKRFSSLVEKLRDSFDYVIFDTPPVSLFVDAAVLGSLVDGTLFVVRQSQTKRVLATKCIQQLRVANASILGTVMTFCSDDESSYYYAYYSRNGKRVNKEDLEINAVPPEIYDTMKQKPGTQKSVHRVAASRSPKNSPLGTATRRVPVGRNSQAGNPFAPNSFNSLSPVIKKAPRHKNKPHSK